VAYSSATFLDAPPPSVYAQGQLHSTCFKLASFWDLVLYSLLLDKLVVHDLSASFVDWFSSDLTNIP
jgi:hypothetical protein